MGSTLIKQQQLWKQKKSLVDYEGKIEVLLLYDAEIN